MTRTGLALASLLFVVPSVARAQAGLAEARAVARCVHAEDERIQRALQLIDQAEQRSRAAGVAADVRRDALASIDALVERIREHSQAARHCIEQHHIPMHVDSTTTETAPPDPSHDTLASEAGTVHEVEAGTRLASGVRIVRGERVDGSGSAPDENVRSAVRAIASRLSQCRASYAGGRTGEVHVSFTASDGGRVSEAQVESSGGFDASMARCVEQAAASISISGQRGRSVYAYSIRFEP
jgi:hypothetical protein